MFYRKRVFQFQVCYVEGRKLFDQMLYVSTCASHFVSSQMSFTNAWHWYETTIKVYWWCFKNWICIITQGVNKLNCFELIFVAREVNWNTLLHMMYNITSGTLVPSVEQRSLYMAVEGSSRIVNGKHFQWWIVFKKSLGLVQIRSCVKEQ